MEINVFKKEINVLYAVIMAGGSGTRFWPWSRVNVPKHTLNIYGDISLLEETVNRIAFNVPKNNIIIVTTNTQEKLIRTLLPDFPVKNIIAEPFGRDTAACIGLAASIINKRCDNAVMAVMPADHIIKPTDKFSELLDSACSSASGSDCLITIGIKPDNPSVHYGYIHRGREKERIGSTPFYLVNEFKEKPDRLTAQKYLKSGDYYWNSGIFVWSTKTILGCIKKFMPELSSGLSEISENLNTDDEVKVISEEYEKFEKISIDYGIMEKANNVMVIEADFFWDDVGTWKALERLNDQDKNGNTIIASHAGLNTENCIIIGKKDSLITTANVSDLIIVQTDDTTLVCSKKRDEDIKELVKLLKEKGMDSYL